MTTSPAASPKRSRKPKGEAATEVAVPSSNVADTDATAIPGVTAGGEVDLASGAPAGASPAAAMPERREPGRDPRTQDPLLWRDDGWTARVIKNIDDEGWAVEMIRDGQAEPALVGPWTMGRDKKNPKPLSAPAFGTLVKTATEVIRRHEQHMHAMLHKSITVSRGSARITVTLDIEPDHDDPSAVLSAFDEAGAQLAQVRVAPDFKLGRSSAAAWVENDFRRPR